MDEADELDVVGLGALNVDLIATLAEDPVAGLEDNETVATTEAIAGRLALGDLQPRAFLGGSAFNAIAMLAELRTPLRLGMIGISAVRSPRAEHSHAEQLAALGVRDLTRSSAGRPGVCLALLEHNRRRLFTSPQANVEIADYLREDDRLRRVAASARVLHLTSLLEDPERPGSTEVARAVAGFVERVKADNPGLVLSFDPGRTWVDGLDDLADLRRIYARADVLYVSPQEYASLSSRSSSGGSRAAALVGLCSPRAMVIVKRKDEIVVRYAGGLELSRIRREHRDVAVDPTGAGDAVAAGVLASYGAGRGILDGCRLGLRIAAQRVSDYGDRGHGGLRDAIGTLDWLPSAPPGVRGGHLT